MARIVGLACQKPRRGLLSHVLIAKGTNVPTQSRGDYVPMRQSDSIGRRDTFLPSNEGTVSQGLNAEGTNVPTQS